jgi:2-succinyl-6-hydroxy-2,4-cyclohexadiene-1-carboxylate synthase
MTVVFLHGFLGDRRDAAHLLAQLPHAVALDLPGHGEAKPVQGGLTATARQLWRELDQRGVGEVRLCGYSLGGRLALHMALQQPGRCRRLVVVSASPGLASRAERQQRAAEDARRADELEREGLEAFLARWYQQPLFAPWLASSDAREALRQRAEGQPQRLATALRQWSVGRQRNLWPALADLGVPSVWLAGALDAKYAAMAPVAAAQAGGQAVVLPAVGHVLWHEAPAAVLAALR